MANLNLFVLAADKSPSLLPLLRSNPSLASSQDEHGYSLLHAAASYNHLDLLRSLTHEFHVNPNIKDEDGETPMFVVETVEAARLLVEELDADASIKNSEGFTAEEKIRTEGDFTNIADFLRENGLRQCAESGTNGNNADSSVSSLFNDEVHPPPLPPNVKIDLGTMSEVSLTDGTEVDSAFRQRIEELAARDDFQAEEGQRQLRELITGVIRGVGDGNSDRVVRRRVD